MTLNVSTSSVEWFFFTWYGRKVDFFSIECRKNKFVLIFITLVHLTLAAWKNFNWKKRKKCTSSVWGNFSNSWCFSSTVGNLGSSGSWLGRRLDFFNFKPPKVGASGSACDPFLLDTGVVVCFKNDMYILKWSFFVKQKKFSRTWIFKQETNV